MALEERQRAKSERMIKADTTRSGSVLIKKKVYFGLLISILISRAKVGGVLINRIPIKNLMIVNF